MKWVNNDFLGIAMWCNKRVWTYICYIITGGELGQSKHESKVKARVKFNPSRPDLGRRDKINLKFIFILFYGVSKGLIKVLKAFIKPFEAPQKSVNIKIYANFHFNKTS